MQFSVIMPIYKVEDYLREAIDSVLNQTYKDFELILVDDGSPDGCPKICDEYADKDSRVKVIHKENGGLSSARNDGIQMATGEYLMFIDSDDYLLENTCLENLSKIAMDNYDVIQYKSIMFYQKKNKMIYSKDIEGINSIESLEDKLMELVRLSRLSISAWDKIVKTDIIKSNNIYFTDKLISEDVDWSLMLYQYIDTLYVSNLDVYVYRKQRAESITTNTNSKAIDSTRYILKKWTGYTYRSERLKEIFMNYLAYTYLILLTTSNKHNISKDDLKAVYSFSYLLKFSENYKIKMANKIKRVVGFNGMIFVLKTYLWFHNFGMISL